MGVLSDKSINVAFDVDIGKRKPISKPYIQNKLETWQPSSPTKEEIQSKLHGADKRRKKVISNVARKAAEHYKGVKHTIDTTQAKQVAGSLSLEEKISTKLQKATRKKENITKKLLHGLRKDFVRIQKKVSKNRQSGEDACVKLETKVEEKMQAASFRKAQIIGEKKKPNEKRFIVEDDSFQTWSQIESKLTVAEEKRVKTVREKQLQLADSFKKKKNQVKECREKYELNKSILEVEIEKKQYAAAERKANLNASSKFGIERSFVMTSPNKKDESLARKIHSKIESAAERKERLLAEKVASLSENASYKSERVKEVLINQEIVSRELDAKIENKMISAKTRKQHLRDQQNEQMEMINDRRKEVFSAKKSKIEEDLVALDSEMKRKQSSAEARKEAMLAKRVNSAKKKIQRGGKVLKPNSPTIEKKLEEAGVRREQILLQKATQSGNRKRKFPLVDKTHSSTTTSPYILRSNHLSDSSSSSPNVLEREVPQSCTEWESPRSDGEKKLMSTNDVPPLLRAMPLFQVALQFFTGFFKNLFKK